MKCGEGGTVKRSAVPFLFFTAMGVIGNMPFVPQALRNRIRKRSPKGAGNRITDYLFLN